jgi:hypothetical protein
MHFSQAALLVNLVEMQNYKFLLSNIYISVPNANF